MEIKPFGRNILVEPVQKKQILVSDSKGLCEYGKVVAIGGDVKEIKIGDTVGFLVWGVNSLVVENDTYYFVPESDEFLLGVLNG